MDGVDYQDTGIRWVKVLGCEYRLEENQILEWLSHFGEIRSDLSEDTHEGSDDSSDDLPPVGNGIYSVKMKLSREIPQFIPMHGKKVRLYYRGITKRCTHCFGSHQRKNCKNEKVTWYSYVKQFVEIFPKIPVSMYGKWANMTESNITKELASQKLTVDQNTNSQTNKPLPGKPIESQEQRNEEQERKIDRGDWNGNEDQTKRTNENKKGISNKNGNKSRIENENKNKNESKTGEPTEEEINQLVKSLMASGITAKMLEERINAGKKATNTRQRGSSLGRGSGKIRGKNNP